MNVVEMTTHLVDEFGDWIDGDDPVDWVSRDVQGDSPDPVRYVHDEDPDRGTVWVRFESGTKLKTTIDPYEGDEV